MKSSNRKIKLLCSYLCLSLSLSLYFAGEVLELYDILQWAIVFILIFFIIKYFNREYAQIVAFLICFAMFLVNRILLSMLDSNINLSYQDDDDVMLHLHRSIYLALFFLNVGIVKWPGISIRLDYLKPISKDKRIVDIERASLLIFYFTSVFRFVEVIEKVIFVMFKGGYLEYYASFSTSLPGIFRKLGNLNEIVFFVFLSTLPDPRKKKAPFAIFLLFGILTLLYGQRNGIITSLMMLVVYIIIYENVSNQRYRIIERKVYGYSMLLIPFALFGLNAVTALRGRSALSGGMIESIETFLGNIGNSIRVIVFGYVYADEIGHDKIYSMGKVIDFFCNNAISRVIFGNDISYITSSGQTEEFALNGYSYSAILTYLTSKSAYLAGHGLGSSYIAEVFHDFGYLGIVVSSIVYGKILRATPHLIGNNWIINTIVLMSFYNLLLTPRDTACKFLASFVNFQFIITIVLVIVIAYGIGRSRISVSEFSDCKI